MDTIKVNRTEQTIIKSSHKMYSVVNDFSVKSRIMYNHANWYARQCFIREGYWLRYQEMQKMFKTDEKYKSLMSQSSQCVLQVLDRNWVSYYNGIKQYKKDNSKFLNRPKIPKYIKSNNWTWFLKNNNTYIKEGRLYFRLRAMNNYSFKTSIPQNARLISVRFVPRNNNFILEIVYEIEIPEPKQLNDRIVSIDLGLDNFITMSNNIGQPPTIIKGGYIKSQNQWYNKYRAELQSKLDKEIYWSKRLDRITAKRYNQIKNYIHHTSKYIMDFCMVNDIDAVIVGLNETWKQEINLGSKTNQNFVFIPYDMLIRQLEHKCQDEGKRLITTEESYTSGTSALDDELPIKEFYNKSRRIKRGLFKTNNGILINADVNGSLQIGRKVNPNAFDSYGLEECLNPIIIKNVLDCYKLCTQ